MTVAADCLGPDFPLDGRPQAQKVKVSKRAQSSIVFVQTQANIEPDRASAAAKRLPFGTLRIIFVPYRWVSCEYKPFVVIGRREDEGGS